MFFLVFTTFFLISHCQASIWDTLTVNIAIVEYQPYINLSLTSEENLLVNTLQYVDQFETAAIDSIDGKLDIIIFPESTLNNIDTAEEIDLYTNCADSSSCSVTLQTISQQARYFHTYVVINVIEKIKCTENDSSLNCLVFGFKFYNTDFVFNRNGTLINKYHKYHLFGEIGIDIPEVPEEVIISTDFGVNLGIFTCMDILFKSPAQDLLGKVDGIIFPTMWFSQLPFLTAMQTQQMWAYAHDLTLFAAEANNPSLASGGSGAYRGTKGTVSGGFVAEGGTRVFTYKSIGGEVVPSAPDNVDQLAKSLDDFYLKRYSGVDNFTSVILNLDDTNIQEEVCHEDLLCCNFDIKLSFNTSAINLNYYTYHLAAFAGSRSFGGVYSGGIEICAILACLNSSLSSCALRFSNYDEVVWPITFEEITIQGNFEKDEYKTQFPNSLLSSLRPIVASKTEWTSVDNEKEGREMTLQTFSVKEKQDRILTFGIYGRDFLQEFIF